MSWLDNLRPATFRGVPFEVEASDVTAGRRVTLHEYPQRDKPYAEDMGRATREYSLTAFVIGTGYIDARDALLAAIETEGSGELIHPFFGTMNVVITRCRVSESRTEGGMARFDLSFAEAGVLEFPAASIATGQVVVNKANKVMSSLSDALAKRFAVTSLPNWASQLAGDEVTSTMTSARRLVAQADSTGAWLRQFDESATGVSSKITTPASLSNSLQTALTAPSTVSDGNSLGQISRWAASGDQSLVEPAATTATDPVNVQVAENQAAIRQNVRASLLAQGAVTAAGTEVTVYQDAMAFRDAFLKAIDAEMSNASDDALFQAWADLRGAVYADLTTRARNAARLEQYNLTQTAPALAVAYDLYEDAGRDSEIVARNAIKHPGFVPPKPILVLSS